MPEPIPNKTTSDTADERNTEIFLRTNGPAANEFSPDIPPHLLAGMTPNERYLSEMACISAKQNGWLIKETIGLKGAHRAIHRRLAEGDDRFGKIDATLKVFTTIHDKWLTRQKVARNIILAIVTILMLPTISLLLVELLKPWLFKVLSIHP